jgi:hypothetical protein
MSLKNGMTSAMMNAATQLVARMPTHTPHPIAVFEWRWTEFLPKTRKKMKRAVTELYNEPRKTIVGIANENAIFL